MYESPLRIRGSRTRCVSSGPSGASRDDSAPFVTSNDGVVPMTPTRRLPGRAVTTSAVLEVGDH